MRHGSYREGRLTPLVLDIETNQSVKDKALNKRDAKRKSLSPFRQDSRILYVGLWYPGKEKQPLAYTGEKEGLAIAQEAVDRGIPILGHHTKYDILWLLAKGLRLPKNFKYEDSMYTSYVAGRKKLSIEYLEQKVLGLPSHKGMVDRSNLENSLFQDDIKEYCQQDVQRTFEIWKAQRESRRKPLYKFLCDLAKAVLSMEFNGLYVPKDPFRKLESELRFKIAALDKTVRALGFRVNLGASEQALIFLKHFGYEGKDTDSNNLRLTQVQLKPGNLLKAIELVLEYRKVSKLLTTFIPLMLNNYGDRLHSVYSLVPYEGQGAITGRLASVPNAQNFPRIIKQTLVAPPGKKYLSADYGQIELRIGAELAQEKRLLQAFKEGRDVHADTVAMIQSLGTVSITDTDALRTIAKQWNFGVGMFGAGADTAQLLLARAGVYADKDTIKGISRNWKKLYPRISKNANNFRDKAATEGKLRTPTGRRRSFAEDKINAAANYVIQSLSSDICQTGTMLLYQQLCDSDIKLIVSEHDKAIIEYPDNKNYEGIEKEVTRLMTKETKREFYDRFGYEIKVPLTVDAKIKGSL